jgi:endonuclease V-like protein UPF0215 family
MIPGSFLSWYNLCAWYALQRRQRCYTIAMAFKDPQAHRAWMKQWYLDHKEKVLRASKEYERTHKKQTRARREVYRQRPEIAEHLRAYNLKRYHDSLEYRKRCLQLAKERRAAKRREIIALFGGSCKKCGFSDTRALQVDHITGGGRKEFRNNPKLAKAGAYLAHIRKNQKAYQLLCANCNWIKRYENNEIPRYN